MEMAFIVKFDHQGSPVCFLSNEQTETLAILLALSSLFFSLGDDHSRAQKALDKASLMDLEQLKQFKFSKAFYHYRSVLAFSSIREITQEQYNVFYEFREDLSLNM